MKQVSKILLSIAVTLVSLVATVAACVTILNLPSTEQNDVAAACKVVKVGMTFAQMSAALHGTIKAHGSPIPLPSCANHPSKFGSVTVSMNSWTVATAMAYVPLEWLLRLY